MKILCDVCCKREAALLCIADEAALCGPCDHSIHHANKLAGKHKRLAIHHKSGSLHPLCDTCKEKRALLFCQQDRAILCQACDLKIHGDNYLAKKHDRFLLTGLQLSATRKAPIEKHTNAERFTNQGQGSLISASSISEYFMKTLPGWRIDDFLDSSPVYPYQNSKVEEEEEDLFSIWDTDLHSQNPGFRIPLAGISVKNHLPFSEQLGFKEAHLKDFDFSSNKSTRKQREDNFQAVPQISSSASFPYKRSRTSYIPL